MKNRRNYYRVLEVQPDAPLEVIKASYRTLMQKLKYHPDLGGDDWNAAVINEAYRILSDPKKREGYDTEQAGLEKNVGAAGRSRTSPPPKKPVFKTAEVTPTPREESPGEQVCAFCKTANPGNGYREAAELCAGCGSPLRMIALPREGSTERRSRRIDHQADIHYRVGHQTTQAPRDHGGSLPYRLAIRFPTTPGRRMRDQDRKPDPVCGRQGDPQRRRNDHRDVLHRGAVSHSQTAKAARDVRIGKRLKTPSP